ncbi:MAE_28990/MAE_18760 family HEPN-like nuclease [Clostridium cibarium]|uniref:RiboL-PSP-HEPN domain-containing protein n=1 Tax=Clostridium cibarium TaxID=2762247 RepID=A0ABR8PV43_9CLOT|nr:MAE_28990/MAE_18760 family HEPN-like nuclease [Clostridium cibarium]MBD7912058.1 hypothetical protein [Clostridium cibarium]
MELALIEAIKKIDGLRKYIELSEKMKIFDDIEVELFDKIDKYQELKELKELHNLKEFVGSLQKLKTKKMYDYNLIIVTMYGILENYVEESIKEYLSILNNTIMEYNRLPNKITENHIIFCANLLKYIDTMSKYEHIKKSDVIKNLNSCLSDKKYTLNLDAFIHHTSNFRYESINEIYNNVGIQGILNEVKNNSKFIEYNMRELSIEKEDIADINNKTLFFKLEDLAERRNQIAHGIISDNLLSLLLMSDCLNYVDILIKSINEILDKKIVEYEFEYANKEKLNEPIKIIDNRIICLEVNYQRLKVGNKIFAYNKNNNNIKCGRIISMKIGEKDIVETPLIDEIKVGVMVDFRAKDNYEYYFVK